MKSINSAHTFFLLLRQKESLSTVYTLKEKLLNLFSLLWRENMALNVEPESIKLKRLSYYSKYYHTISKDQ